MNSKSVWKITVFSVIVGAVFYFLYIQQPADNPVSDPSQTFFPHNIESLCKRDSEFVNSIQADPACKEDSICLDGWIAKVYYDKQLATEIPKNFSSSDVPEELKNAAIAEYDKSDCNCEIPISYRILSDGQLEETDCESFYSVIESYNSSCDNCVTTWETGCC